MCRSDEIELVVPTLDIPLGERVGPRPVANVRVRLLVDEDGAVRHGELGGAVSHETVGAVAAIVSDLAIDDATIRSVAHADLDRDAAGECQAVSLGVGIDLATATLTE